MSDVQTKPVDTAQEHSDTVPVEGAAVEGTAVEGTSDQPVIEGDGTIVVEGVPVEGQEQGEVVIEEGGDKPAATAKRAAPKRKITAEEHSWLQTFGSNCFGEEEPWDKTVLWAELPEELQNLVEVANLSTEKLVSITVAKGQITSVKFTDIGFDFAGKDATEVVKVARVAGAKTERVATEKAPRAVGESRMKYNDPNYRIKKLTESNPRRVDSHGYFNWFLYKDGMTYKEYMNTPYDKEQAILGTETKFYGPNPNQFKWDLEHGFIAVYDDRVAEDDPGYWIVRYAKSERAVISTPKPAEEKAEGETAPGQEGAAADETKPTEEIPPVEETKPVDTPAEQMPSGE